MSIGRAASCAATVVLCASFMAGQSQAYSNPLTGTWRQASEPQELVLKPVVKLQPYVAPGYGMSLGGSVGYGSATSTTLHTEAQPEKVRRKMTLTVAPDQSFRWSIERTHQDGACARTIRQQKEGRVSLDAETAVFNISRGEEVVSSTCGDAQSSRSLPASPETYDLTFRRGALQMRGQGGVHWTFARG